MKETTKELCIKWWKLYDINEQNKCWIKTKNYSEKEIKKIRQSICLNAKIMQDIELELEVRGETYTLLSCNH